MIATILVACSVQHNIQVGCRESVGWSVQIQIQVQSSRIEENKTILQFSHGQKTGFCANKNTWLKLKF